MNKINYPIIICATGYLFLASCASQQDDDITLGSLDVTSEKTMQATVFVKPKTDAEVRQAYYDYVRNAPKNDGQRLTALNRLAEIELQLSNKLLKDSLSEEQADEEYLRTVNNTIQLLTTSLQDYPNAAGNDRLMYQLAKAHDQIGQQEQSLSLLKRLVGTYPKSDFYAEAQFRLAERYFIESNYIAAEDAYTEVMLADNNFKFYEKALFKRGWSRYKQQFYLEAVDDYLAAVNQHSFTRELLKNQNERDQFDEYLRAIALSFTYLGGAEPLSNYFNDQTDFSFIADVYQTVGNIFVQQERYTDAAEVLEQYVETFPQSQDLAIAHLQITDVWRKSGFVNPLRASVERLYNLYNPQSSYWETNRPTDVKDTLTNNLRELSLMMAEDAHAEYLKKPSQQPLSRAQLWYERYLTHFDSYARKDNVFLHFAELLDTAGKTEQALPYFELAAWDGDIVLDKKAAYATITITDKLASSASQQEQSAWLSKYLQYVGQFAQIYPGDKETTDIIVRGTQLAFNDNRPNQVIALAELLPVNANNDDYLLVNSLLGQVHFNSNNFELAESVYSDLMTLPQLKQRQKAETIDRLALSIYRQAEQQKNSGNTDNAIQLYEKISTVAATSSIAPTALFDGIALAMSSEQWNLAINLTDKFNALYPKHANQKDVARNRSIAYLNSNQGIKAAQEFERISKLESDNDIRKAALIQAAELYEEKKDVSSAIRSYRDYANNFKQPFNTHMEVMSKLAALYLQTGDGDKAYFWQNKIRQRDQQAPRSEKTARTNFIASSSILQLAKEKHQVFDRRRLRAPFEENLRRKKIDMQDAVKLYGQSSSYGITDVSSEATYAIGKIYQDFSVSLLESERPAQLNEEQLEQYNILIEDQAFPFEEKAIEFYETNVARTRSNVYNPWIQRSIDALSTLFPFRYQRELKREKVIRYAD